MAYESIIKNITSNPDTSSLTTVNEESEEVIQIDSGLRQINVPKNLQVIGVTGDQKVETLYFQIPRYFDGRDLWKHDLKIRYTNAKNEYGEYAVTDKSLITDDSPDETFDDYIVFSWEITNYVTRYAGTVDFTVQFETITNEITFQWQTVPAKLLVKQGINTSTVITSKDDNLYRSLITRIQQLESDVAALKAGSDISTVNGRISAVEDRVSYIEGNAVYTITTT